LRHHKASKESFLQEPLNKYFSTDWFSVNIFYWKHIFYKKSLLNKNLSCLEIGSWEGRSALFLLSNLPKSNLTCVDTWAGADEHKDLSVLSSIEKTFDTNLAEFDNRVQKFKGTSYSFFDTLDSGTKYDLIYIDGSHYVDDVMLDALKAFQRLNIGGIIIFDDYFWSFYDNPKSNPAVAINAFINLKREFLKVEMVYSQIIISRIASESRNL
jgi:predicted O-methyltransferase YrrM